MRLVASFWFLVLVLAAMGMVIQTARARPLFVIAIEQGRVRRVKGQASGRFLSELLEVCRRHGLARGRVLGFVRGGRVALEFSRNVPQACRQQIRNVWSTTGWRVK